MTNPAARSLLALHPAAGLCVVMAAFCGSAGCDSNELKTLPVESIYVSIDQLGTKKLPADWSQKLGKWSPISVSNIFLVRADTIEMAIKKARFGQAESITSDDGEMIWLVAYLGSSSSSPPRWTVSSLKQSGSKVRLSFKDNGTRSDDLHPHFVFAPLNQMQSPHVDLELVNAKDEEVVLSRRIAVVRK